MACSWLEIVLTILFVFNKTNAANDLKNERDIRDKVVIVTGGAQGIGYAIADNSLKNGARVVIILDINVKKGNEAETTLISKYGENKAEYIKCDITKDLAWVSELIMLKYGYVDLLVNNVGIADERKPQLIMLTNAMGTISWCLKFLEYMRKDNCKGRGGTIMNIVSVGVHTIDPTFRTYRASKLAVLGFSLSQGHLYNYDVTGVRVIALSPGPTNTSLVYNLNLHYDQCLKESILKYANKTILQSPDNVGRGAMMLFENAESGTSWDVADEKLPIKSINTLNVVPFTESCKNRKKC